MDIQGIVESDPTGVVLYVLAYVTKASSITMPARALLKDVLASTHEDDMLRKIIDRFFNRAIVDRDWPAQEVMADLLDLPLHMCSRTTVTLPIHFPDFMTATTQRLVTQRQPRAGATVTSKSEPSSSAVPASTTITTVTAGDHLQGVASGAQMPSERMDVDGGDDVVSMVATVAERVKQRYREYDERFWSLVDSGQQSESQWMSLCEFASRCWHSCLRPLPVGALTPVLRDPGSELIVRLSPGYHVMQWDHGEIVGVSNAYCFEQVWLHCSWRSVERIITNPLLRDVIRLQNSDVARGVSMQMRPVEVDLSKAHGLVDWRVMLQQVDPTRWATTVQAFNNAVQRYHLHKQAVEEILAASGEAQMDPADVPTNEEEMAMRLYSIQLREQLKCKRELEVPDSDLEFLTVTGASSVSVRPARVECVSGTYDWLTQQSEWVGFQTHRDALAFMEQTLTAANGAIAVQQIANSHASMPSVNVEPHLPAMALNNGQRMSVIGLLLLALCVPDGRGFAGAVVTGGAGCGKSAVINRFVFETRRMLRSVGSVKVTATTGAASCLIHGVTTYAAVGLHPSRLFQQLAASPAGAQRLAELQREWELVRALIVDEMSMLSQRFMAALHGRLMEIRTPFIGQQRRQQQSIMQGPGTSTTGVLHVAANVAMGGVFTVLSGDTMQLDPVGGHALHRKPQLASGNVLQAGAFMTQPSATEMSGEFQDAVGHKLYAEHFRFVFFLEQNMRQLLRRPEHIPDAGVAADEWFIRQLKFRAFLKLVSTMDTESAIPLLEDGEVTDQSGWAHMLDVAEVRDQRWTLKQLWEFVVSHTLLSRMSPERRERFDSALHVFARVQAADTHNAVNIRMHSERTGQSILQIVAVDTGVGGHGAHQHAQAASASAATGGAGARHHQAEGHQQLPQSLQLVPGCPVLLTTNLGGELSAAGLVNGRAGIVEHIQLVRGVGLRAAAAAVAASGVTVEGQAVQPAEGAAAEQLHATAAAVAAGQHGSMQVQQVSANDVEFVLVRFTDVRINTVLRLGSGVEC